VAVLKLTHTRLLVDNIDACYRFYRDTLGFKPRFDGEGSVYAEFDMGGHMLALFSRKLMNDVVAPKARHTRDDAPDSVVVTFEVPDVDAVAAHLRQRGVSFISEPHDQKDWLLRVAHFRDPDGNLIEINAGLSPKGAEG
jgi:catechol 2,3-dioxygenase-like lactoylglutathione lyase family enzyme